jgi:hypothetical protein
MKYLPALLVASSISFAYAVEPPLPATDEELVAAFRCPESYTDSKAYIWDMARFLAALRDHHPDWTTAQILDFRFAQLKAHNCAAARSSNGTGI